LVSLVILTAEGFHVGSANICSSDCVIYGLLCHWYQVNYMSTWIVEFFTFFSTDEGYEGSEQFTWN